MLRTLAIAAILSLAPVVTLPHTERSGEWLWPVDTPHSIVRGFVAPSTPYAAGHRGIDIRAPSGVVYAPAAGIVHFVGFVVDRPVLSIRHVDGVISSYEPVVANIAVGDVVTAGQVVGTVTPGHCAQLCVHMGVRVHGQYVSPLNWLGDIPPSVLLPTRGSAASASASVIGDTISPWLSPTMRHGSTSRRLPRGGTGSTQITRRRRGFSWTSGSTLRDAVPADLAAALDSVPAARANFEAFPKSARRAILEWIAWAKTAPTREKRVTPTAEKAARRERATQWLPRG